VKARYVSGGQLIQWGGTTCVHRIPRLLSTLETWQLIEAWKCNLPSIGLLLPRISTMVPGVLGLPQTNIVFLGSMISPPESGQIDSKSPNVHKLVIFAPRNPPYISTSTNEENFPWVISRRIAKKRPSLRFRYCLRSWIGKSTWRLASRQAVVFPDRRIDISAPLLLRRKSLLYLQLLTLAGRGKHLAEGRSILPSGGWRGWCLL
jgi:hypothetical protein